MDIQLYHDFSRINLDDMREVYESVGWTKHRNEIIKQVFDASNVTVFASVSGRTVGFGRSLSDGVFNAAIYDVVVHKEFQKLGIAKRIIEDLLDQLQNVSCVHFISTTGNEEFYRKVGFKKIKTGMARYLNQELDAEYLE
ncbi:GNAT family N-acetyltransferase [Neobacillus niacini]|uniref:GNAT family N-acetyltransferase n=1 Tax=Neobacillus niacini TaxID=86668 RepID=UPI00286B0822|nr:GNAT family N-acetyltransferase [Neobacillus niacini]